MSEDAAKLNQVSSELVAASRVSPEDLAVVANNFATTYGNVVNHSMQLAGATKVSECYVIFLINIQLKRKSISLRFYEFYGFLFMFPLDLM